MKNFTKQNFKTNPLWIRLLIMAFMLLAGAGNMWAAGFWGDNAWNIKFYSPSQDKDMWINDNYDAGHGNGSTIDLGTFTSAPYLKGYWAKTWGYGNDTNKYVKVTFNNTTTSSGVSKQWDSNGDQMWKSESLDIKFPDTEGSHEESITFAINGAETMTCKIKYKICTSCCTNYYLQHPWNGGNWTWKELKKEDCNNNIYKLTANYGNAGCDYSKPGVQEKQDYIANPTLEGNPAKGDECIFTFDANKKTITITKVVTCNDNPDFSVSLSKSEVAVGCTGVTASIKGNDSPTVTWSSSSTNVATINNSTGAITIKAAGTTTITATTTEAGGFCGGVKKPATLTVKSPSVTVKANDNSLCEGETLTLTATLTNCGEGNSIQWYKEANPIAGETSTTLTISSVTTANSGNYKAVVSGGILCSNVESTPIAITVNARPSAPILTTGSTNVCPGTLTLAIFKAMAEQNTVVWYSNEECTQVVTTPTVEKGGTYKFYAKSKNASGCFSEGYSTLEVKVYDEPADFTLTAIPAEICSGADVIISISNKQDGVTYKLGNETIDESIKVNPTEDTEYYTVTAYLNACPDLTKSISTDIKVNPIPSFTVDPTNLSLCKGSTSETDLTVLSHVEVANGDPVWYDAETAGNVVTEGADLIKGGTYWVAAENAEKGCVNPQRKSFTLKIHDLPKYPDLTNKSAVVCQEANATVSLNELAEINDVIWYQGENEVQGPDAISIAEAGTFTYTAKAVNNNGCQSATGVDFILTVNPIPTISISGSEKAVLYEDVTLTATATDGATVKWYEDDVEKGEGLTYVVTSETATSKIVTAKAFLNGCESAVASHTVAFSAETCAPSNQIQIICTSTKSTTTYCYAFYGSNKTEIFGSWPGTKGTASGNVYSWTIENKDNVTIIFNAGKNTNQTDDLTGHEKGKKYFYTFDSSKSKDNTPENYTLTDTEDILSISAPAAKTISVSTTEGEGNIIFSGQVVKTGCDATNEYGFQYSSDEQTWTTVKVGENAAAGTAISNNTVKGLDGTYYVRAYITNDNSTQYGAVTEITVSTVKTPISNVAINYSDIDGKVIDDPNPMCKGAIAYVKLSYVGSKYSDIKWLVEGVETNLVTDKGNGVWSYIIQGTGHLSVELRNDANKDNEDNPTWATSDKLSFTMKEEPVAPYISINPASGVICQGSSATIKVENPSTACSYKLVEGDTETGFTKYESGDLKYTVQNVGKYYVVALHDACTDNEYTSNQVAINQIISTSAKISIEPKNQETTPWEPVNITVTADEGYVYEVTYTGNNLQDVDGVIIKQKGDTYTYYIPRPTGWGEGNAVSVRTPVAYGIKAQLKVDGEANQCNLSFDTATITVKDEEDEDCD